VFEDDELLGIVEVWDIAKVPTQKWDVTRVRDLTNRHVSRVSSDCDVMEGLRLLLSEHWQHMLLVTSGAGKLEGVVTKTDILQALKTRRGGRFFR
jgi:CIC family chloride channel protein